jgi:Zn-dependent peptidase ImmA (M78 family)
MDQGNRINRVTIKKEVLHWALSRSGLTADTLQRKFPKLRQWETGESEPTLRQLESLAKATLTPLGFLFLAKPPAERLPIPHFRTFAEEPQRSPSPAFIETIQMMQQRQSWMRDFLIEKGQDRLPFIQSIKLGDAPQAVAGRIRQTLKLEDGWASKQPTWTEALRLLRETMESAGILVVVNSIVGNNTHRKLDLEEFRGFVLVDDYAPLVFVNGTDSKAAQMFTLAHELAHVFFGSSAAFDLREMQPAKEPLEQACNRMAAEFLVPASDLPRIWGSVRNDPQPFQAIARQFKVSELVAARRALDLGLIPKAEFLEFYRTYQKHERRAATRRPGGGDFYATQNLRLGRRYASAVAWAAKESKLLYSEAYRLTGLYGKTFDRYAASLGIGESL